MRFLRPLVLTGLSLLVALAPSFAASDRKFTTPGPLRLEAQAFVGLLERYHYNHQAVSSSHYVQVIPDFMYELDRSRLFFLGTDKARFNEEYAKSVYYNVAALGNVDAAYRIFEVYQTRLENRIAWIFEELKKEFDFAADETYGVDRTKADWPATIAASDDLWRKRLKYELIGEMLNKKSPGEAKTIVSKRYERMLKSVAEINGVELAELYLSTIAHLFDPHSTYFSAPTFEDFAIQMKLQLVGIGALLGLEEDTCVVREIVFGGPADLGHELKPNDKIISVAQTGGEPVELVGMKLRKIVDLIRGQKGTQVHLTVQPAGADPSVRKEIVITRDLVKLNAQRARAALFQVPGADGTAQPLGVITLPAFYNEGDDGDTDSEKTTASKDVARLIEQLKQQKIQGLVLDLRRNGGGYLGEAIELAGLFIAKGPIVQVKSSDGDVKIDEDPSSKIAYDGPLAVLVDRFSASASEIVAGALQNYGRAIVIGDSSTHGKGSVQQVVEMKNITQGRGTSPVAKTGAAKFTVQKYYLPSGASTQREGVVPDIVLPSINDFLPIGESDLPHALVWDQIPTSSFDGAPLDSKVVTPLRQASLDRQSKLKEFAFLRKGVDRFKIRQEQKLVSVKLDERLKQKEDDDSFRKEMKSEKELIAKDDYPFKPFYLGPPPPPKIKAPKKEDEDDDDDLAEENETYVKADIHLRESLRVVSDAIALGRNRDLSVNARAPLTAGSHAGG